MCKSKFIVRNIFQRFSRVSFSHSAKNMYDFLNSLPKVELHAHLNGSLNTASLRDLGRSLYGKDTKEFTQLCARFIEFNENSNLSDCFKKFGIVHELTATPAGLEHATELVIRDFAQDNVMYLELRTTPKENQQMTRRQYLEYVLKSIERGRTAYPGIIVKLLLSINRAEPVAAAEETVALALELKQIYGNVIAGIDLSGNPYEGNFQSFGDVLKKAREGGLPLALHCGEIDNPEEIKQMLEFGMSRCGHGTFLSRADIELLKQQDVAIECCLTSNVKSATVPSYGDHHLKQLVKASAPKVLCTDDCGVFDTTLSKEFLIAAETFKLTRKQCIDLTAEAIRHAFATTAEQNQMQHKLAAFADKVDKNNI